MRKPAAYLFAILVGAIIWFFFQHFKVEGTDTIRVVPKTDGELNGTASSEGKDPEPVVSFPNLLSRVTNFRLTADSDSGTREVPEQGANLTVAAKKSLHSIRIASLHLNQFAPSVADSDVIDLTASIVRQFDIVALQGVRAGGMASVVTVAETAGEDFESIFGSPASVQHQDEQFAYIFNNKTIVADRGDGLYTLGDPDDLLRREPLIGWFRAKQASAEEAFTFTLVNVNIDPRFVQQELSVLDNAMHEIRGDGRDEDDVIMLGCFQAAETQLGELGKVQGLVATIRGVPTTLAGTSQTENILFRTPATDEFTGRSDVFHFMRAFNLSAKQAKRVSDFFPVWAEFSIYEGGQRGRVAGGHAKRR